MTPHNLAICRIVAKVFGITVHELLSRSRVYALPRQVAMDLCWQRLDLWNAHLADRYIAEQFKLDDSTVRWARHRLQSERKNGYPRNQARILLCEDAVRLRLPQRRLA